MSVGLGERGSPSGRFQCRGHISFEAFLQTGYGNVLWMSPERHVYAGTEYERKPGWHVHITRLLELV